MDDVVVKITKMADVQQRQALLSFAKLPSKTRVELFGQQSIVLHKLRQNYAGEKSSFLAYCALLIVVQVLKNNQDMMQSLNFQCMSLDEILNLTVQQIQIFKHSKARKKHKTEQLFQYFGLLKTLKGQQLSYRAMSEYLQKYHRINISYSMVYKFFNQMEKE